MIRRNHGLDYAAYLKGDAWKCSLSPTGAHHWLVSRKDTTCKYCLVDNVPKPPILAGTLLMSAIVPSDLSGLSGELVREAAIDNATQLMGTSV